MMDTLVASKLMPTFEALTLTEETSSKMKAPVKCCGVFFIGKQASMVHSDMLAML